MIDKKLEELRLITEKLDAVNFEYSEFVEKLFKQFPTEKETLHHAGTGVCSEAGEIIDITKGVWVYGKNLDIDHLIEELGDLRFYYQAMLNILGITDQDIISANFDKLSRRYPDLVYKDEHAQARLDKNV